VNAEGYSRVITVCGCLPMAIHTPGVLFGGRLAQYAYFDMDDTVAAALVLAQNVSSFTG